MRKSFHAVVACITAALTFGVHVQSAAGNPVINEIMYRPGTGFPENTALEYIEIYNPTGVEISMGGWALTSGVPFTFPAGTELPPGGYLTVAADPAALNGTFGSVGAYGPWAAGATLSNNGEKITLSQPGAVAGTWSKVDEVSYATEGDWAQRYREPVFSGWAWTTPANGGGKSVELRNPALSNDNGQNWAASTAAAPGGTPGTANTALTDNVPPVIHGVKHSPGVPRSTENVTISCEVNDEAVAASRNATLFWRNATNATPPAFSSVPMLNDGEGKFTAVVPPAADKAIIEFYISSNDGTGTRIWPASNATPGQAANCQYQVDNEVSSSTADTYRLILTGLENADYNTAAPLDRYDNKNDRQFNITLIITRGSDHDIRYASSIRFRGNSSRSYQVGGVPFKPLRVSISNHDPLDGVTDFNLNPRYSHLQHIGMRLFQAAGLPAPDTIPVEVRRNGLELTSTSGDYGKWVRMEDLNAGMADNHWPLASSGNLYKKGRPDRFWRSSASAPSNPDGLLDGWSKQNNSAANDWSDLTTFFATWQANALPHFSGASATDVSGGTWDGAGFTADEMDRIETVADTEQWARWFAVMTLLEDNETNISNGQDDDYAVYFVPSAGGRRRMQLLPHDLDTILGKGDSPLQPNSRGLYDMTAEAGSEFRPLLPLIGNSTTTGNAAFRTSYHDAIRELCGTVFNTNTSTTPNPPFFALVDNHLGDWAPANFRSDLKTFMAARCTYLLGLIGDGPITPPAATATSTRTQSHGALIISEVLASNATAHVSDGLYRDVIEVQNTSAVSIDLAGKSLSDDPAQKLKFVFPASTVLPAGEFIVLYADSDFLASGLHSGFQLDAGGDAVYFYDTEANGQAVLDSVVFGPQATDFSIGRTGANLTTWALCTPTIGAVNTAVPGLGAPGSLRINEWLGNADFRLDDDFLEIYNPGTLPVPMGGMRLTDDFINLPAQHALAPLSFIGPGGFHVFTAKGSNATPGNPSELPFSIDSTFGWLALSGANGTIVDRVSVTSQPRDQSTALSPDGNALYATQAVPSPGLSNGSLPAAYMALLNSLRITEFIYKPVGGNDYEFVELKNTGATALDLSGVRFTNGIDYTFPPGISLAPGAFIVVARNRVKLLERFTTLGPVLAPGEYAGALDNNGETIALSLPNPWDVAILNFTYETTWEPLTFSAGHSLTAVDPAVSAPRDWNERETWTVSSVVNGTPGSDGPPAISSPLSASGIKGDAFSYQISASRAPTAFGATGLPAGLIVNTGNGQITGTPVQDGTFNVSLGATNTAGTGTATLVLTVATSGPLHQFSWDFTTPSAEAGVPFPAVITARDVQGRLVTSYSGSVPLTATAVSGGSSNSTVVITEVTDEAEDQFEMQNTGTSTVNTDGWFVVIGNSAGINAVNPTIWQLPDSVEPGEILLVSEQNANPIASFFGVESGIQWTVTFNRGWIMLFDSTTTLKDFFVWGWTAAELSALTFTLNSKTITTAGQWTGNGSPVGIRAGNNDSWQRIGNGDENKASDWTWVPDAASWGLPNAGLNIPWAAASVVILNPPSAALSGGVFAGFLTTPSPATGVQITASSAPALPAQSAPFDVFAAETDTDSDKIPDSWENATGLNPAVNDAADDPDKDGWTNLREYYAGTDPRSAASVLHISSFGAQPPSQVNLEWPVSAHRLYRVGYSTNLVNWAYVPGQTWAPSSAGTQSATFVAPQGTATTGYYRVQLITPP